MSKQEIVQHCSRQLADTVTQEIICGHTAPIALRRADDTFQGIFSLDMIQEQHRLTSSDEPGQSCSRRGASEGIEAGKVVEPDPVEPRDSLLPPGTIILGTHACIAIITAITVVVTAVVLLIIVDVAAETVMSVERIFFLPRRASPERTCHIR